MANINISDLGPARTDLFLDSESYINDLTEGEMMNKIVGGGFIIYIYGGNHTWVGGDTWNF